MRRIGDVLIAVAGAIVLVGFIVWLSAASDLAAWVQGERWP